MYPDTDPVRENWVWIRNWSAGKTLARQEFWCPFSSTELGTMVSEILSRRFHLMPALGITILFRSKVLLWFTTQSIQYEYWIMHYKYVYCYLDRFLIKLDCHEFSTNFVVHFVEFRIYAVHPCFSIIRNHVRSQHSCGDREFASVDN